MFFGGAHRRSGSQLSLLEPFLCFFSCVVRSFTFSTKRYSRLDLLNIGLWSGPLQGARRFVTFITFVFSVFG